MNRNYSKIIVSTLLNMLKTTPYDEISVATLCRTAGVSRQSFYYYFADLNDCLMSIIIAEGVNVRKNGSYNNIRELLMDLYNYIYANRVIFTNIATSSQAGVLYEKIQKLGKDILRSEITKWIPDVEYLSADDMDYILSFYFANFISSISSLSNSAPVYPEVIFTCSASIFRRTGVKSILTNITHIQINNDNVPIVITARKIFPPFLPILRL